MENNIHKLGERVEEWSMKIDKLAVELDNLGVEEDVISKLIGNKYELHSWYKRKLNEYNNELNEGSKKECVSCKGKGFTLKEVTETDPNYPKNLPDSGWVTRTYDKEIPCKNCSGKGYLELQWA